MLAWLRRRRLVRELRRLERLHLQLLEQARDLQRNGDIRAFAERTAAAAAVEQQLEAMSSVVAGAAGTRPAR